MKKFFAGIVLTMVLAMGFKAASFADMGAPEIGWFDAIVTNPDGMKMESDFPVKGEIVVPYGTIIKVYEESGDYYHSVYFVDGVQYSTGALDDMKEFEPVDTPVDEYPECNLEVFTYKETELYSIPSKVYGPTATIPAGVELKMTHRSGDLFGYVEGNGYAGWTVARNYAYYDLTIMYKMDAEYYVFGTSTRISDENGEESGEYIAPGEKIHVIGGTENYSPFSPGLFLGELNGRTIFVKENTLGQKVAEPIEIHITSPGHIESFKGFEMAEDTELSLNYDEQIVLSDAYLMGVFYYYYRYADDYYIIVSLDDRYAGFVDCGFYIVNEESEKNTYFPKTDVVCMETYESADDRVRSTIKAGTEVESEYCDYRGNCYVEGYGWADIDDLTGKNSSEDAEDYPEEKQDSSKEETVSSVTSVEVKNPETEAVTSVEEKTEEAEAPVKSVSKTFYICLVFAIVIAVAAVFGIVTLVKNGKKKAGEREESIKTEENSANL